MSNIKTSGIDNENRVERRRRAIDRRNEDVAKGLSLAKSAQRGDFKLCRELDPLLKDFKRFKDPKDRAKINAEYYGLQKQYKDNHVLGK